MSTQPKIYLTPEQYLEIERKAETRSEYYQGEMFAMAGNREEHMLISWDISSALHRLFSGRDCRAFPAEMRVFIPATGLYTYPDIAVVCGERKYADKEFDTLLNPGVIVEVLSPSTEKYDRTKKFDQYRSIESLREYILVASDSAAVDLYSRQPDGRWLLSSARGLTDWIEIPSLDVRLGLAEIYQHVTFETTPPLRS